MTLIFPQHSVEYAGSSAGALGHRLLMLALVFFSGSLAATSLPNQPIATIDLNRYMGQWHEIAHLPLFFQRKCSGPITATSGLALNGEIEVRAVCATRSGPKTVDMVAISVERRPAAFKIRVVPAWLSWLPYAWFEYWVVDIDPNYQWVVVGGPGAKHLWILSRNRSMNLALYQRLVSRARERGYPVGKLLIVAPLDGA